MKGQWLLVWALVVGVRGKYMSLSDKKVLNVLFSNLGKPITSGIEGIHFNVPDEFVREEHRNIYLGDRKECENIVYIPEDAVKTIPDLSICEELGQNDCFSPFIPKDREIAEVLLDAFLQQQTLEDFVTLATYARSRMNPKLFSYCYSIALLQREDTQNVSLPNAASVMPGEFLGSHIFKQIEEQSNASLTLDDRLQVDDTESDTDVENRVSYFREDVGINLHHYNWHLLYPFFGSRANLNKDRRGELFCYLHEQALARYDCERLTNKMKRVIKLENWREPIAEAYYPDLDSPTSDQPWTSRPANSIMQDLDRPDEGLSLPLSTLEAWRDRTNQAISEGRLLHRNGSYISMKGQDKTDVLENVIESSTLSVNPNLYGNLHNSGHVFIGYITDPGNQKMDFGGVMLSTTVSMRDPVFYRWHAFIDHLFQEYKRTLSPYTRQQLGFSSVSIISIEVHTNNLAESNILNTFWDQSQLEISRGLSSQSQNPVYVNVTHLQHVPFIYRIKVQNSNRITQNGMIRLFLAPRFDGSGKELTLSEKRTLFIELDKFPVTLRRGQNTFERNSVDSSVTIPHNQTFQDQSLKGDTVESTYCGCGWPQHMLIPKGKPEGLEVELFVMVTNNSVDQIQEPTTHMCRDAWSYCGIRGEKYPDQQPMGFPFDRPESSNINTLDDFKRLGTGNMYSIGVTIYHNSTT